MDERMNETDIITQYEEPKTEFKAGDYIVFTKGYAPNDERLPINYCFKQLVNRSNLRCVDIAGETNGWTLRAFNDSATTMPERMSEWRYATPEEAEYYEMIGKPFNVIEFASRDTYSFLNNITLQKDGTPN